jgi:hypothetical protein
MHEGICNAENQNPKKKINTNTETNVKPSEFILGSVHKTLSGVLKMVKLKKMLNNSRERQMTESHREAFKLERRTIVIIKNQTRMTNRGKKACEEIIIWLLSHD